MKIKEIIEYFKIICNETGIHPSEDCLFENAVKVYISNKIGENKRENIKSMKDKNKPEETKSTHSEPQFERILKATPAQITTLIKMQYPGDINSISKNEAWKYINENKSKGRY